MIWFNKWLRKASMILDTYVGVQLEWVSINELYERDEKGWKAFEANSRAAYWVRGNDFCIPFDNNEYKGVLILKNALWQDQNFMLELMDFLKQFVLSGHLLSNPNSEINMDLNKWIMDRLEPQQAEVIDLNSYRMMRLGSEKSSVSSVHFVIDADSEKRREKALGIYRANKSLAFVNWQDLTSLGLDWTNELGGITIYISEINKLSDDEKIELKNRINLPTTVAKIILGFEDENQVKLWK